MDLQDRLIEIPVEPWSSADFKRVAKIGEDLLNVSMENIIDDIILNSFDSIGVFQEGIKRPILHDRIKKTHHRPDDVRPSDMSYFLHNIVATQVKKNIIPPLFDYDRSTRKLKIIDSTLYFFLRNVNKEEVFQELEPPV